MKWLRVQCVPDPPPGTPKPVLTGAAETAFAVRLTLAMQGHDLIEIFGKRGAERDFKLSGGHSPYLDGSRRSLPNTPELRQYRAVGLASEDL